MCAGEIEFLYGPGGAPLAPGRASTPPRAVVGLRHPSRYSPPSSESQQLSQCHD